MMLLTGAGFLQQMRCLYCPASIGWVLGGCRVAVPYAFVAAVTAEVIASRDGLGFLIKSSSVVLNPAGMFASILVLMAVTAAAGMLVGKVEKWSKWRL
jgi:NitT/TauT family transport system permease protein